MASDGGALVLEDDAMFLNGSLLLLDYDPPTAVDERVMSVPADDRALVVESETRTMAAR